MSRESRDNEQLDALATELAQAGSAARTASARREKPKPEFAAKLRVDLVSGARPARAAGRRTQARPLATAPAARATPAVPAISDASLDRRALDRPFVEGPQSKQGSGKRWRARQVQTLPVDRPGGVGANIAEIGSTALPAQAAAAPDAERQADRAGHVAILHPSVRWRLPTRLMPSRWVAIGLVACLVFASLLYGTTQLFPVRPFATADVAVSATVVRGAVSSPLAQGDELHQGDEIWVGADGRATIAMGGSFVRMAPESDLRLDSLDQNQLVVAQLAGRAYHRASVGATGSYQVITGSIAWTAHGTAFDLDRQATETGDEVRGLALLDGLDLSGPELSASLGQGDSAVVELNAAGSSEGDPTIEPIEISTLDDPWLLENAQLDMLAGLDMGELALVVSPTPTLAVTSSGPPTGPTAAATATVKPAKGPTARPTAAPTRKPTSRSTPAGPANLGKLTTKSNGDGTYTFTWPRYAGVGFSSYRLMHGPAGSTPTYPTSAYWARLTTRNQTSWTGRIDPGDYAVRLQAVDESKKAAIKAQTGVVRLKVPGPSSTPTPTPTPPVEQSLGLSVVDNHDGTMTFTWDAYSGGFDYAYYKLVYGPKGSSPSYLNGDSYFIANSPGNTSATLTIGDGDFISGEYAVRVQAIGTFNGSDFVFGESAATDITVP